MCVFGMHIYWNPRALAFLKATDIANSFVIAFYVYVYLKSQPIEPFTIQTNETFIT